MTPQELKKIRKTRFQMSRSEFAVALGWTRDRGKGRLERMEKGDLPIPNEVISLINTRRLELARGELVNTKKTQVASANAGQPRNPRLNQT